MKKIDKEYLKLTQKFRWWFILFVAIILISAITITIALEYLLLEFNIITNEKIKSSLFFNMLLIAIVSVIIDTIITVIFSKKILNPINSLVDGMNKLSKGKYDTRIEIGIMERVSVGFNKLAKDLENVQILRQDYINNFSHELKTPIVSIKGLISLMKNKDLSKEKQTEYLEIIEDEINRLSILTTNILNLSKYDNQEILTDLDRYNVSEQIRRCVLLLEKEWKAKNLTFKIDFDEFDITANEDMLKQVFINLIDNAIKFSYENTIIDIDIKKNQDKLSIFIGNVGSPIDKGDYEKIFQKFYQADNSHSKSGNGIGLSIVKKIVELHRGQITVESNKDKTIFRIDI